jgi:hypothetical protein
MKEPLIVTYGDGKVWTQQGEMIANDARVKCLTINKLSEALPVNSVPREWKTASETNEHDLIIEFKNIEGARTLQDELNELISKWSRELAAVVDFKP